MIKELFKYYGIAAAFASVRKLHADLIEAKERITTLESQIELLHAEHTSDLRNILATGVDDYDVFPTYTDTVDEVTKKDAKIYGKEVKPFSIHKSTSDLVKEARTRYDSDVTRMMAEQAAKQEQILEELVPNIEVPDEDELQIRISEQKQRYILEKAKTIVGSE